MKIVFVSNYFNHHQRALCDELYKITDGNYKFVVTEEMSEERKNLGYGESSIPDYVVSAEDKLGEAECKKLVDEADVVLYGSAPWDLVAHRIKQGKLTFRYSERRFKEGIPFLKLPLILYQDLKTVLFRKNLYMLCAGAYTAKDYAVTGAFVGKTYKWGYFPETKQYDNLDDLINRKKRNSLLWVGRFIDWKHPEIPVEIAKRLKNDGYEFELDMIGSGELIDDTRDKVRAAGLADQVRIPGAVTPVEVRAKMEQSQIFVSTSDRNEGWGAVINEAMNSACATVACKDIGSAPYLITDMENGVLFEDGNIDSLYRKIKWLLDNPEETKKIGARANRTIVEEWNARRAAERLCSMCEKMLQSNGASSPFADGICSKAERRI